MTSEPRFRSLMHFDAEDMVGNRAASRKLIQARCTKRGARGSERSESSVRPMFGSFHDCNRSPVLGGTAALPTSPARRRSPASSPVRRKEVPMEATQVGGVKFYAGKAEIGTATAQRVRRLPRDPATGRIDDSSLSEVFGGAWPQIAAGGVVRCESTLFGPSERAHVGRDAFSGSEIEFGSPPAAWAAPPMRSGRPS